MEQMEFPCPCTYKGESHMITTKWKDFTTKNVYYYLKGVDGKVPVDEVTLGTGAPKDSSKKDIELIAIRTAYKGVIGKDVPNNKKNNVKWMTSKIDEVHAAAKDDELTETPITFELLMGLNLERLKLLIKEKELEVDPEDYLLEDQPDNYIHLCGAICSELGIEFPTQE